MTTSSIFETLKYANFQMGEALQEQLVTANRRLSKLTTTHADQSCAALINNIPMKKREKNA